MSSVRTEGERKKCHPNNYLIQFNENFIRSNTKQQKQGMGIFMPCKKKQTTNNLSAAAVEGKKEAILGKYRVI